MPSYMVEVRNDHGGLTNLPGKVSREQLLNFQAFLTDCEQGEYPLRHFFAEAQYGREITIPAGHLIVGKIHKHAHLNLISKGECTVVTEFGSYRIKAPHTFVSEPGTKRALYTHSETVWTTIHTTLERDLAKIEEEIIAPSFGDYDSFAGILETTLRPILDEQQEGS